MWWIVGEIGADFLSGGKVVEGRDDAGEGVGVAVGEVGFAGKARGVGKLFDGRGEVGEYAGFVAAGIDAVPAVALEVDGDEAVQEKGGGGVVEGEALVAERGGDAAGAEECGEQVALRVAEADAVFEDVGRGAGDGGKLAVRAVADVVADPEEAAAGDFLVVGGAARDLGGRCDDGRVVAVDGGCGGEEFVHRGDAEQSLAIGSAV